MKYDELYKNFISSFSDDEPAINAIAAENAVDDKDGMHSAFGMIVLPFLSRLVEENQTAKIEKAFAGNNAGLDERCGMMDNSRECTTRRSPAA